MSSVDRSKQRKRRVRGQKPLPDGGVGESRRNFMRAAGAAGVALMLGPPRSARAKPGEAWVWVDPDEVYDPRYEYRYVYEDGDPAGWEWVDLDEPFDPMYDYVFVDLYEDGRRVEWVRAEGDEPFDPNYDYLNYDDSPIFWEWLDGDEREEPGYYYEYEYEYIDEYGLPSEWEWVEPGEPFDARYEYVYEYAR